MFKFVIFCTLMVCVLSAPTDKQASSTSSVSHNEKPLLEQHEVDSNVSIYSPSTAKHEEKREKREDAPAVSSSDNKRTPLLSQPDYQENKPPTFVHPVPVDQIIKNSHASPQIHSAHRKENEETINSNSEEEGEEGEAIDDDNSKEHHRYTHKKITGKTNIDSNDDEDSKNQ